MLISVSASAYHFNGVISVLLLPKLPQKCFTSSHNWIRFKFRGVQFSSNRMIASQHYTPVQL